MSFRGFDIGPGINHYADLMAQGQKDQIELQKMYAQQAQAQADKEFNRQMLAQRTGYLYGQPGSEPGLSQADKARADRTQTMADAASQNKQAALGVQVSEGAKNRALEASKQNKGMSPEAMRIQKQIDNEKIIMDGFTKTFDFDAAKASLAKIQALKDQQAALSNGQIAPQSTPMYAPQQPRMAAPAGQVLVKMPDGSTHYIPQDKVSSAVKDYKAVVVGQ